MFVVLCGKQLNDYNTTNHLAGKLVRKDETQPPRAFADPPTVAVKDNTHLNNYLGGGDGVLLIAQNRRIEVMYGRRKIHSRLLPHI